jgi:nucleosome binding factor SPN SPT16 subunit
MGIEFREGSLSITPTCDATIVKGMVFNVNIGLTGLINKVSFSRDESYSGLL